MSQARLARLGSDMNETFDSKLDALHALVSIFGPADCEWLFAEVRTCKPART